jgi:hypothetical protein
MTRNDPPAEDSAAVLDGLLRVELSDPEQEEIRILRAAQRLLLKYPVAGQAAFSALVAEGRRFAETPEGQSWKRRLSRSSLVHRARLVWEITTLWMLEEDPPNILPSAYLDALCMAASSEELEPLLDRLFREPEGEGSDGDA